MSTHLRAQGRIARAIREVQGRRADEVAATAGLTKPYLSHIENGRRRPTAEPTTRLAAALGIDVAVLTGQKPPIETLRVLQRISLRDLAADLGITAAHLTRLERGVELPDPALRARLARRLGVDPAVFDAEPSQPSSRVG